MTCFDDGVNSRISHWIFFSGKDTQLLRGTLQIGDNSWTSFEVDKVGIQYFVI